MDRLMKRRRLTLFENVASRMPAREDGTVWATIRAGSVQVGHLIQFGHAIVVQGACA